MDLLTTGMSSTAAVALITSVIALLLHVVTLADKGRYVWSLLRGVGMQCTDSFFGYTFIDFNQEDGALQKFLPVNRTQGTAFGTKIRVFNRNTKETVEIRELLGSLPNLPQYSLVRIPSQALLRRNILRQRELLPKESNFWKVQEEELPLRFSVPPLESREGWIWFYLPIDSGPIEEQTKYSLSMKYGESRIAHFATLVFIDNALV